MAYDGQPESVEKHTEGVCTLETEGFIPRTGVHCSNSESPYQKDHRSKRLAEGAVSLCCFWCFIYLKMSFPLQ